MDSCKHKKSFLTFWKMCYEWMWKLVCIRTKLETPNDNFIKDSKLRFNVFFFLLQQYLVGAKRLLTQKASSLKVQMFFIIPLGVSNVFADENQSAVFYILRAMYFKGDQ